MNKPTNKEEAIDCFRKLISRYGLRWTAIVPERAYTLLVQCNEFLTEEDRRNAIRSL